MANLNTLVPAPRPITPVTAGANGGQNNVFVDSSPNNFVIARNGNTTQGTFSPYGDNWSNYFDGTDDYLTTPSIGAFTLSGDFTIEAWVYVNTSGSYRGLMDARGSASGIPWTWYLTNTNKLAFYTGTEYASTTDVPTSQWVHLATTRSSNTLRHFVNGVLANTPPTVSGSIGSTGTVRIGSNQDASTFLNGYISNLRLVTGSALYTSGFTPPSAPLTAISGTQILACQSNRFRDVSTNNCVLTRNGDVSVQRFSPFSPVAYSAPTIGGSGYFDGSGDYLNLASASTASGDYTIEFWAYKVGSVSSYQIVSSDSISQSWIGWITNETTFYFGDRSSNSSFTIPNVNNSWAHFAVVRSGTTTSLYVNGSSVGTRTQTSGYVFAINQIGCYGSNLYNFNGYLSDFRLVVGTAVYTASFTPPTSPLSAITNTNLLLNFQNAAILDNAMMAVPETVGNAQIDTTIKKFGTGSLEFDGTGDYLKIRSSDTLVMGTGDFTVEFWIYLVARTTYGYVFASGPGTNDLFVSFDTNGNFLRLTNQATVFAVTGTIALTTWTHIAVVRSGSSSKIYVDGTGGTAVTCTTNFTATAPSVGASNTGTNPMNGFIDDLRITKGVARYTANFTPPQAALAADRNTVLLLNADSTSTSNIQVDTYTTTGTVHTWTKPVGAKAVMINIRGAGGGGGGGQGGAATSTRLGGGGGGGGARVEQICTADCLPNTLYVIVGAGGAGGAGGNAAIGSAGTAGGNSFVAKNNTNPPVVGIVAFAGGGGGGSGGFQNSNCGGGGGGGSSGQGATSVGNTSAAGGWPGYSIASGDANGGSGGPGPFSDSYRGVVEWGGGAGGSNQSGGQNSIDRRGQHSLYGSGGGGPGMSIASNQVVQTVGGIGGNSGFADYSSTVGAQPGANGTNGSAGATGASYLVTGNGGGGGGGGGVATATGGTGGTGGAGGLGGGGGGGGGGAGGGNTNGIGGTGGAGGNGVVEIITYF